MNRTTLSKPAIAGLAGVLLLLLCFLALGPPTAAGPLPVSSQDAAGITVIKSAPAVLYQNWPAPIRIPYTLTLQNPQNRTIAAGALITDDLPPGSMLESGSTGPGWAAVLVMDSTLVTYTAQNSFSSTSSLIGTYNAVLMPPVRDRSDIVNAAYCFSGTVDGTPRAFCETTPVNTIIRAPDFGLAVGTTGPVCAGGRVTYTLTVTNPGGVATSVPFTLTGRMPPALMVVPETVSDGGTWVSPTVTWTVPAVLLASGGNRITRTFAATVAPDTPADTRLTTTYRFTSPEVLLNVPLWEHGLAVVRTTAAFTHTAPVCPGRLVWFYNLSQNATAYQWNFGDGSPIATETSPTHSYANPGTYTAILTATGPCGTAVATGTVTVHPLPSPHLFINPSPTRAGISTALWDIGTGGQQWLWDFGDGFTAHTFVPSTTHIYTRTGSVVASVAAIAETGCISTSFRALTVEPGPPCSVALTAPPMARLGTPVEVRATVNDCFGNPVQNGTVVTFAASPPATVAPVTDTTRGGAARTFVSSTVTGTVTVTGVADGVSGTATIRFTTVWPVYLPLVMRSLTTFCAPQWVATLDAGPYPFGVAIDPAGHRAFIAHQQGVRVIDTISHNVITDVRSVTAGFGVAYDPEHNRIWVATRDAIPGRVRVLDGSTYALLATLPAGDGVHSVAYNPNTDRVYVSNFGSGKVGVYNAATLTLTAVLTGFGEPAHMAVNTVTNKIYVADHESYRGVVVIDGTTHARRTIQAGPGRHDLLLLDAYGVAVDATRNQVYVTGISQGRIALIDGATDVITGAMDVKRGADFPVWLRVIAVNPNLGTYGHLWTVTSEEDREQNRVLLIPVWPMGTPPVPLDLPAYPLDGIALDPTTNRVWVTSVRSGKVTIVQDGEPLCLTLFSAERMFRIQRLP